MTSSAIATPTSQSRHLTFEDLRGLRAEGYVRDSTLDQKDGYGPEIQRKAIDTFAGSYGLEVGGAWYTDFITGTSSLKRSGFQLALQDARSDHFEVLLVYRTSRFARNRADAIRYKQELRALGKVVVFVSQGIISGNDNDFLNEGINEVLDEHYSRNLSRWVSDGLRMKHENGMVNGKAPLGYRSEKAEDGKRERKVPDPATMKTLLELLRCYASGRYSHKTLADHLNAHGHRTMEGNAFTKGGVEHVLGNRFYEGKAVYHPGQVDEEVRQGEHRVPEEVKVLWVRCQDVKRERSRPGQFGPRGKSRIYPLTGIMICDHCEKPYHGEAVHGRRRVYRRMYHYGRRCEVSPRSVNADRFENEFGRSVLSHLSLDESWREAILKAVSAEGLQPDNTSELKRVDVVLTNLRKQHLWGAVSDAEFQSEFKVLEQQRRSLSSQKRSIDGPDLDRAAQLLKDLPALWSHPGVEGAQRKELAHEIFEQVRVRGSRLVAVTPRDRFAPLFAHAVTSRKVMGLVGVTGLEPATSSC